MRMESLLPGSLTLRNFIIHQRDEETSSRSGAGVNSSNTPISSRPYCHFCGLVDEYYDEYSEVLHEATPKHKYNQKLREYNHKKSNFYVKGTENVFVTCSVPNENIQDKDDKKIIIQVENENQKMDFVFHIQNKGKTEVLICNVMLSHPQQQFEIRSNPYTFDSKPHVLGPKSTSVNPVIVHFKGADVGQYEMPIFFTFCRGEKLIVIARDMVITVQDVRQEGKIVYPFKNKPLCQAAEFLKSPNHIPYETIFRIPKLLKKLLPNGLTEEALQALQVDEETRNQIRQLLIDTKVTLDGGITVESFIMYFHFLLWWEEIIARINLRRYNMFNVNIERKSDKTYWLEVPGLAEKRPSLLRGDRAYLRLAETPDDLVIESFIAQISENSIQLAKLHPQFNEYYRPDVLFHVQFLMSRVPMERMHTAVARVSSSKQTSRIFPVLNSNQVTIHRIKRFHNKLINENAEQRSAVEHIVAGTSGLAPYIVFGPPGTGKTMTIVEAIVQIVKKDQKNRVWVCTDSNMAADHVALNLFKYKDVVSSKQFMFRANSQIREWSIMPKELIPHSNGSSYDSYYPVTCSFLAQFNVVITTLMHSAKYGLSSTSSHRVSHLVIDEAAQAKEPAALIPISGLLAPTGLLVLSGDPKQLGPVCVCRKAAEKGLGMSLLERLWRTYENIYRNNNPNYITTLVNNFRSDPEILRIPNKLFYSDNPLVPCAKYDPLSKVNILGGKGGQHAVVFHSVNSQEQQLGKAPSYFNQKELEILQRYTKALVEKHKVSLTDIGIIAPYFRQVSKMRDWLRNNNLADIEIGTVESFQGKEKRVILISTVRANCKLLAYDAKYGLGFLVDDKRFNVAMTRAKAKVIVVGNAACLKRDVKWRIYMDRCNELDCYFGNDHEQLDRTSTLLREVAETRFNKSRVTEKLKEFTKDRETT